ncbi:MAG: hypothetical protein R2852_05530 [Bacteroidia bacterium]
MSDNFINTVDCILLEDGEFTQKGFYKSDELDSVFRQKINISNCLTLYSNKYKRNMKKQTKKYGKSFKGYNFYLLQVKLVLSNTFKTPNGYFLWPKLNRKMYVLDSGTVLEINELLSAESLKKTEL